MKSVTVQLPDSVELSEAEIQQLVLTKSAERQSGQNTPKHNEPLAVAARSERPIPPAEEAELRQLIGLYYAERATRLVDEQWDENGWTAETMHEWLREHLRTAHGRPTA